MFNLGVSSHISGGSFGNSAEVMMTMRTILAEDRAINTLAEPLSTFKMASPWRSDVGCLAVAKQKTRLRRRG